MEHVIKNKFLNKLYCKQDLKMRYHNQINHKILQRSWLQLAWTMSSQPKPYQIIWLTMTWPKKKTQWREGFYIVNKI